ncbi:SDR family NAD(P)-dependent oxidoreductase, partial [bacterium]
MGGACRPPMPTPRYPTAIIVGASSGIGKELAIQLAQAGTKVAALARGEDRLRELAERHPSIVPLVHDVTDYASVPETLERAAREIGGCDLIVYSSGVMPTVGAHEYDFAK